MRFAIRRLHHVHVLLLRVTKVILGREDVTADLVTLEH